MRHVALTLDPPSHRRHAIHGPDRAWAETNCYTDLWVELLHAWGFDPVAALPFTLAIDFEGDQWTFFKPPPGDLLDLYGLDVQELALSGPLEGHVAEQVGRGRPVLVEVDSFHLPDTAGTAYGREHVKTTVAVVAIDPGERRLGYFHNQGYFHLAGADYERALRPDGLPPYAEFVKRRPCDDDVVRLSLLALRRELRRMPERNPFPAFRERFETDLPGLHDLDAFHRYSFATLRQFGACFELAATYLRWAQERAGRPLEAEAAALTRIAAGAKALQFQLARAVARGRPLDLSPLDAMAADWRDATDALRAGFL